MKRQQFTSELKAKIVLEGIRDRPLAELCNKYEISQSQYYRWRNQFLSNASEVFETQCKDKEKAKLKHEVTKLKALVGELTVELKKAIGEPPQTFEVCSIS